MNTAELAARERKAKVIAEWLRANRPDVDADLALLLNAQGRRVTAILAGVKPPSDATWQMVVAELRRPVRPLRLVPDDPFQGLPGVTS